MSELKKSLLVTLHFPPDLGGEQSYYYNVCKNLPPDKIVVLAPEVPGTEYFDAKQPFTIIRTSALNGLPPFLPSWLARWIGRARWLSARKIIAEVVRRHHIEIIQVGQILPVGTLALIQHHRTQLPYVIYAHGLDVGIGQQHPRKKIMMQNIIKNAAGIVTNSYFTKDIVVNLGADKTKVQVINPCPNTEAVEVPQADIDRINQQFKLTGKEVILTVGRIIKRKGHDTVIKALPHIIKQVPNVHYVIVGDGPEKTALLKLAATLGVSDHVTATGAVPGHALPAFFERAEVFAMPVRQLPNGDVEGFGIVFLEANSYGTPVIGGRSGGVPEAVVDGTTGLLVDPDNPVQFAKAAIQLLTDKAYANRLGMQGLARVDEQFSWSQQVEKIKVLLEKH